MKLWLLLLMFAPKPPEQPVPYSHKQHAGTLQLACKTCHTNPAPSEMMGFPALSVCMGCHTTIKKDSPHIEKLASLAKEGKQMPWVRVYRIPSFVWFSHKVHLDSGAATCEICHGPVKEREALWKETDITMGGCMNCHLEK